VVGTGLMEDELKAMVREMGAEEYVEFTGWIDDDARDRLLSGAKAFIFPAPDEDFGIVVVEAMAAGVPVITFDSCGPGEIVLDGKTGKLVKEFSQDALDEAVTNFDQQKYSVEDCRARAREFSKEIFIEKVVETVENSVWSEK